jgi:hypothetical protein
VGRKILFKQLLRKVSRQIAEQNRFSVCVKKRPRAGETNEGAVKSKMRKIYSALIAVFALFASIEAQQQQRRQPSQIETKIFRGSIADKKVQLTLTRAGGGGSGGKLSGSYFYSKIGQELKLTGTIDAEGNFRLDEIAPNGAKTGAFKGKWRIGEDEGVYLEGEWTSAKTKQNFAFAAEEEMIFFAGRRAKFVTRTLAEKNKPKLFDINIDYPELIATDAPAAAAKFNRLIKTIAEREFAEFRKLMFEQTTEDLKFARERGVNNYLEAGYRIDFADERVVSVGFAVSTYTGGAHPNHHSLTVNFDLKTGRRIELAELFKPGASYLKIISDYCVKDLKTKTGEMSDEDWIRSGAGPAKENFRSWSITKKGILINFDPYQVAAYAAGPFEVLVPYDELKGVLRQDSPVAGLL